MKRTVLTALLAVNVVILTISAALAQDSTSADKSGQSTPQEEALYVMECAMDAVCRYSLIQSWQSQTGPSAMKYFSGSGEGSGASALLKNTDAGQMMVEIEAINRCNRNTECRSLLVETVTVLRSLPPQILQESYANRGSSPSPGPTNQAGTGSVSTAAPQGSSTAGPMATDKAAQELPTYAPDRRAVVDFDRDTGLVVNGRKLVDPAGPITLASSSNYRGVVTYATGLGSDLVSVDNIDTENFDTSEIATVRLVNRGTDAFRVEVTTFDGHRISGQRYCLIPGGIWVVRELNGNTGFLYSPATGVVSVEIPDTHYAFSLIKGDVLGTNWLMVGKKKNSFLGGQWFEWLNIETGEFFAPFKTWSPHQEGFGGFFQGETALGVVAFVYSGGSSKVQYINFDNRTSKPIFERKGGVNDFNVHLLEDGDLSMDAWGGLSGEQQIESMLDFVSNPESYAHLKMFKVENWANED